MNDNQIPGWYEDQSNPNLLRYWDGKAWSKMTKPIDPNHENPSENKSLSRSSKIIIAVVIAALVTLAICLAIVVSCVSNTNTTSSNEPDTVALTSSESSESTDVEYTNNKAGFTFSLPSEWMELGSDTIYFLEKLEDDDADSYMGFYYNTGEYPEGIVVNTYSGYEDYEFVDNAEEVTSDLLSDAGYSVESVEMKKLKPGTYLVTKVTYPDDEPDALDGLNKYVVEYEILINDYDIYFGYVSYGGKSYTPHLSDFETMIESIEYSK